MMTTVTPTEEMTQDGTDEKQEDNDHYNRIGNYNRNTQIINNDCR